MKDLLGNELHEGDKVAMYFGGSSLITATIAKIVPNGNGAKVRPDYYDERPWQYTKNDYSSKWKSGDCMVKI